MWNSTLEISAREEVLHQSTYQRYDVDDTFSVDDGHSYAPEEEKSQDWGNAETKGYNYQQAAEAQDSNRTNTRSKTKGKHKQDFDTLIANEELDYPEE